MSHAALRNMDPGQYIERLTDAAYDVLDNPDSQRSFINEEYGHSSMHYAQSPEELWSRILQDEAPAASCFYAAASAREHIANAIIFRAPEIAKWFFADRFTLGTEEYHEYAFSLDMGRSEGPIGYGVDAKLNECVTHAIRIVLERDTSGISAHGFYLKTAFPDLEQEACVTKTGRQFRIEDLVNKKEHFQDNIARLTSLYRYHKDAPDTVQYLPEKSDGTPPTMVLRYRENRAKRMDIYVNEEGIAIRERAPSGTTRMTPGGLILSHPERAALLSSIRNSLDRLMQGKDIEVDREQFQLEKDR